MTTFTHQGPQRRATALLTVHAVLFGAIALACYAAPEIVFGNAAWLQLPRLAVLLLAAALVALAIVLIGAARSGTSQQVWLALLAALVLDLQVPIMILSQPASVEHFEADLGIPWFIVPLVFLALIGVTVHCLMRRRRVAEGV
jgi:hypothetical protein